MFNNTTIEVVEREGSEVKVTGTRDRDVTVHLMKGMHSLDHVDKPLEGGDTSFSALLTIPDGETDPFTVVVKADGRVDEEADVPAEAS